MKRTQFQAMLMMVFVGSMLSVCESQLSTSTLPNKTPSNMTEFTEDITVKPEKQEAVVNTKPLIPITVGSIFDTSLNKINTYLETNNEEETTKEPETKEDIKEEVKEQTKEEPKKEPETSKKPQKPNSSNRWNIKLTDTEIDLLARIVWVEARGESEEGQAAVVEVIFNRMSNKSQNLKSVLSAKNQFSSWGIRNTAKNYDKQVEIVKKVLAGKTNILAKDVEYFAMYPLGKNVVKIIGCHYFSTDWCAEVAKRKGK